jgi:acetyl-CoA acetyltransferase
MSAAAREREFPERGTRAMVSPEFADVAAAVRSFVRDERKLQGLDQVSPRGSGVSLGHPVGATGIRMVGALAERVG